MAVMCARQEHYINRKRFQGIMKAYMECYMMLDRSLIFYDTETENIAEMAIEKVLASDAECILCMDDNICMIVLRILRKKGIQIPERIKVASLHNSSLLDEWYPPVSCIHFDVDELGKEASRILYVYLTENKRLPKSVLGYELQMKASTN